MQDPDFSLTVVVGQSRKGGIELPVYKSLRGTNSLENFHLHAFRFVPGILNRCFKQSINGVRTFYVKNRDLTFSGNVQNFLYEMSAVLNFLC